MYGPCGHCARLPSFCACLESEGSCALGEQERIQLTGLHVRRRCARHVSRGGSGSYLPASDSGGSSCRMDSHSLWERGAREGGILRKWAALTAERQESTDLRPVYIGTAACELRLHLSLHCVVQALCVAHEEHLHQSPRARTEGCKTRILQSGGFDTAPFSNVPNFNFP